MLENKELVPMYNNIVVRPLKMDTTTASGLIITQDVKNYARLGEIVRIGGGVPMEDGSVRPLLVKVGDIIAYSPNVAERNVKSNNEDCVVLSENEIYGVYMSKE